MRGVNVRQVERSIRNYNEKKKRGKIRENATTQTGKAKRNAVNGENWRVVRAGALHKLVRVVRKRA